MIIKHGRYIFEELQEVQKGMWAFFFHDCDFQVLVGRAGNSPITWRSFLSFVFTLVICGISVLNRQIINLHVSIHIWEDQFLLDKLPYHPAEFTNDNIL